MHVYTITVLFDLIHLRFKGEVDTSGKLFLEGCLAHGLIRLVTWELLRIELLVRHMDMSQFRWLRRLTPCCK